MNDIGEDYDDHYSACLRTYATLRIYPGELHPEQVTQRLGVQPSKSWQRDDSGKPGAKAMHGWFLSTHGKLSSRDTRRHLDQLLEPLLGVREAVLALQAEGARMDIMCFWHSAGQQGGPALSPKQLSALAALNIMVSWNIYSG